MKILKLLSWLVCLLFSFSFSPVKAEELHLSAAASMTDTVKALSADFVRDNPDVTILSNFTSSGSLAKQIIHGAPADLYISANRQWMDYLVDNGIIVPESARVFAYNSLVLAGMPNADITAMADICSLSRIAMGSPQSVPAGQYAAQAMTASGIYGQIKEARKLVIAKDVRQALVYAERREVDGAFVYRTDALLARNAEILFAVPEDLHDPIVYKLGLTLAGTEKASARDFARYLTTPAARKIITACGFKPAAP